VSELAALAYFVAILTINGAVFARLEGDLGGLAAIGADNVVHLPWWAVGAASVFTTA
jgi:hypothetical protein